MSEIISIGLALDTSQILSGTRQVDAALKAVATASASTAQATKAMDQASRAAGQALTAESQAAQAAAQKTTGMKSAADAAAQAMGQTLATAVAAAAQSMIQAQREAKKAEDELRRVAKATEEAEKAAALASMTFGQKLSRAFGDVAQQAKAFGLAQVGVSSIQSALQGVMDFATSSVRAATQTESLSAAFKAIEGSGQAAGKTMQFLKDTANRLGVDVVALSTGFKTVDAAARGTSLQGEGIRKVFVAMAEASRVLGLSGQDLSGVMLAVGQSISKGTVQSEELRGQIGERLPGAFQIAARAMGVTTAELDKMMERGELQATTFWPRFADTVKKEFGGSVEEASQTAAAAFDRFGNTMRELQVNVGQFVIPALTWMVDQFNAVVGATNSAIAKVKEFDTAQRAVAEEAKKRAGGANVATSLQEQFREAAAEEAAARAQRERIQAGHFDYGAGFMRPGTQAEQAKAATERERVAIERRIALGRQLDAIGKRQDAAGDPFGEGVEIGGRDEKRAAAQQQLVDMVKANRDELEKLDRVTQQLYGRKPTQDEILKTTEKQVEVTRKWIDANQHNWNLLKDTGPAKELRAQAAGAEALEKSIKAAGAAGKEAAKEKKTAADAAREAEKQYKDDLATSLKTDAPFLQQVSDAADLLGELQRRTLGLRHTEEERFAMRVEAMAKERPYLQAELDQAMKQYEQAKDFNDQLRERNKLLQDQAQASAGRLSDITRAMQQFEPRRRGETEEERMRRAYATMAQDPKMDMGTLSRAAEKMETSLAAALDTEMWDKWAEVGMNALDHVSDAIEDFVFKGKLSFKDMLGAIAQDLFHFATRNLMESATKKGGWLEAGLDLGMKALNVYLGVSGGMPTSGTLPTTEAAYAAQAAAGRFSGRQHGGPVSAGTPYWVGEGGKAELFVPRTSGTIVPAGQAQAQPPINVVFNIQTPDVQGFQQSRGAISRSIIQGITQARQQL